MGEKWAPWVAALAAVIGAVSTLLATNATGWRENVAVGVALAALGLVAFLLIVAAVRWLWGMHVSVNIKVQGVGNRIELVVGTTGSAAEYSAEVVGIRMSDQTSVSPQHWPLGWSDQSVSEVSRTLIPGAHSYINLVSKGDSPEQIRFQPRTGNAPIFSFGDFEPSADLRKNHCIVDCR